MSIPSSSAPTSASSQFTYSNASYFPVPFHFQQSAATVASQYAAPYVAAAPAVPNPSPSVVAPLSRSGSNSRRIFSAAVSSAIANSEIEYKAEMKKKVIPRKAAGQTWEDPTLAEWPEDDYRLFCGDLGNEVNDDVLLKAFSQFPSFNMAWVVRDKRTGKTKGYGFVSFSNPSDLATTLREMHGKYVGNRPIKLRKS